MPRYFTIGKFPKFDVDEAREIAINFKRQLSRGIKPENPLKNEETVSYSNETFKSPFDRYINNYANYNLTTQSLNDIHGRIIRNAKVLFKLPLKDITKQDIISIFDNVSKKATIGANRTLTYLSAIFSKGIEWELLDKNPTVGIKKNKEISRDRCIALEEKEQFLKAVEEDEDQQVKDFILMSLYTGARKGNVLAMRWDKIDFGNEWYLAYTRY